MGRYVCPVCGKNCNDLSTLSTCIAQHIQTEEKQKKEKAKEIIELKQKAIRKKSDELITLIKEFNDLPDNPLIATCSFPTFTARRAATDKKKVDTNKKNASSKTVMDLDKMIDDLYGKIKRNESLSKEENAQISKDLEKCLGTLLGSLLL